MKRWGYFDDFYAILQTKDGDKILDEIIKHFDENNLSPLNKTLIIDQHEVELDFNELLKYPKRLEHYHELGYEILIVD